MEAPIEPIRVSTTPTFRQYLGFVYWASFRQLRYVYWLAAVLLAVFAIAPLLAPEPAGGPVPGKGSSEFLLLLWVFVVLTPLTIPIAARRRWRNTTEVSEARTYVFSEDGVQIEAESFRTHLDWSLLVAVYERKNMIALRTAQSLFYLFPLESFESPEELARFRELVKRKVAKHVN